MKAVVGFFRPGGTQAARTELLASGFRPQDVKELRELDDVPHYIEGKPEKAASRAWLVGALIGALVGAALGLLLIFMFEVRLHPVLDVIFVLVALGGGAAIGGYLTAIYTVRAEEHVNMDVHEALSKGTAMLMVQASMETAELAADIMRRNGSDHIDTHVVPDEELQAAYQ